MLMKSVKQYITIGDRTGYKTWNKRERANPALASNIKIWLEVSFYQGVQYFHYQPFFYVLAYIYLSESVDKTVIAVFYTTVRTLAPHYIDNFRGNDSIVEGCRIITLLPPGAFEKWKK